MRMGKLAAGLAALTVAGAWVGSGISLAANPAGNNGTIKVDAQVFDTLPDNEPHVGCDFQIDFYGFDSDATAKVTFEAQPPSGRGVLLSNTVNLGPTSNAGGGSVTGLDAQVDYNLSPYLTGLNQQANQGYHVMLTINATGSQGSDVKHKVFWVRGCTPPPTN